MSQAITGEDDTVPALLNSDDYGTFAELDLDYFLAAAGDRVRRYLGWHCWPTLTQTGLYDISGDGTIMLPTRYLTSVVSVSPVWNTDQVLSGYRWDQRGWISLPARGYGFSPSTADLWPIDTIRMFDAYPKHQKRMSVTFTHGYPQIPPAVAEVGYELAMRALEKPAGVASQVQAGPYNFKFSEFGLVLSDDQKDRLAFYKIPGIT